MEDEPVTNNLVGLLSFMVNRSYIENENQHKFAD
jgi:hypothetical protein